jgi:hypothetical protein
MDTVELAKRITILQDIEAIKKLKAEYCDICDDDHNQDRIVTIFVRDGIWEGEGVGYAKGHAEIQTPARFRPHDRTLRRGVGVPG